MALADQDVAFVACTLLAVLVREWMDVHMVCMVGEGKGVFVGLVLDAVVVDNQVVGVVA